MNNPVRRRTLIILMAAFIMSAAACGNMYSGIMNNKGILTLTPPVLNNLSISDSNYSSITLEKPSLANAGFPPAMVRAYIGEDGSISVSGPTVSNYLQTPVDVTTDGCMFSGLTPETMYRIIVVAQNMTGRSVQQILQRTGTVAPVLNDLSITGSTTHTLTLDRPSFAVAGSPLPSVVAYIGIDTTISVTETSVTGSIQGPVDVSSGGYTFNGLDANIAYRVIVVAENVVGYSVKEITQRPAPVEVTGLRSSPGKNSVVLAWNDPVTIELDHIEITWSPDGETVRTVAKGLQTFTVTGLTNGTTYTFTVNTAGAMENISDGLSIDETPIQQGCFVYTTNEDSNNVYGYIMDQASGQLQPMALSPWTVGSSPRWIISDPTGKFVYTANNAGDSIHGFTIDQSTGILSSISGSPWLQSSGPAAAAIDPSGRFLYVANSDSNDIYGYSINSSTGSITEISGSPLSTGTNPSYVQVHPAGYYVYVSNFSDGGGVSGFSYDPSTGELATLSGSPYTDPGQASSLYIHPDGNYLYLCSWNGSNGLTFSINGSGILTNTGLFWQSPGAGAATRSITLEPSGKFAYIVYYYDGSVCGYYINPSTGAPEALSTVPAEWQWSTGSGPIMVTHDPAGTYLYTANYASNNISGFTINSSTGALTEISGSPWSAGTKPNCIAVISIH